MLLDDEKFDDWLALFDDGGIYEISRLQHGNPSLDDLAALRPRGLERMLEEVHEHVRDPAQRRHVVGIPLLEIDSERRT